jgi:hypothetical protein
VGPLAILVVVVALSSPLWVLLAPRFEVNPRAVLQAAIAADLLGAVLAPDVTPSWSVWSLVFVMGVCIAAAIVCFALLRRLGPVGPPR